MTDPVAQREPGSHLAAPLRRDAGVVQAGVITPAGPQWPSTDPDTGSDPYADHLQDVLDGLHALGTYDAEQEGQHR